MTQRVGRFRLNDSVGETPTDAVETTALPENSLMIGIFAGRRTKFFISWVGTARCAVRASQRDAPAFEERCPAPRFTGRQAPVFWDSAQRTA
jgi:hypothetical protein